MWKLCIGLIASLSVVLPALAQKNCPTINGKHIMDTKVDGEARRFSVTMYTRNEGGLFSYTPAPLAHPDLFHRADGVFRPITVRGLAVKVRTFCSGANTVQTELSTDDGSAYGLGKLTPIDQCRVRYESDLAVRSGVYTKCY